MRFLWLFLVGCTHTETIAADPATSSAPPAAVVARSVTEADVKRVEAALTPPVYGADAGAPLALGAPCDGGVLCGTAKRTALQAQRWPNPAAEPCSPTVIGGFPDPQKYSGYTTSACIVDQHLYARTQCTMCRLLSGIVLDVQLDELTPPQREHLRQRLALPAKAPLATAADWQSALRAVTAP